MSDIKVLIVEDQVALEGRPMEAMLKAAGYDVVGIAENAEEAVKMTRETCPTVVLMDIMLPEGHLAGVKAAHTIQEMTNAEVVYVTGIDTEQDVLNEVRRTRSFQFLKKPVPDQQLLCSVRLAAMKALGKAVVFLSYSHKDGRFVKELLDHTRPLKDLGVHAWADSEIGLGGRWKQEINNALQSARAAICLVSIDFVNSAFIREVELPKVLRSAAEQGTLIVPVFVRAVARPVLLDTGLLDFQGINAPEDPIAEWTRVRRDRKCWVPLCERLRTLQA